MGLYADSTVSSTDIRIGKHAELAAEVCDLGTGNDKR